MHEQKTTSSHWPTRHRVWQYSLQRQDLASTQLILRSHTVFGWLLCVLQVNNEEARTNLFQMHLRQDLQEPERCSSATERVLDLRSGP